MLNVTRSLLFVELATSLTTSLWMCGCRDFETTSLDDLETDLERLRDNFTVDVWQAEFFYVHNCGIMVGYNLNDFETTSRLCSWRILDVPVVVVVLRLYVCIGLRQGSVFPVCFQLGPDGSMPARARWQHARARLLGRWIVGCCRCWCHSWTQPVDQGPFTFTIASSPRWPWPCGGQFAQFTIASSPCESRSSSLLQRNGHSSLLLRHSPLVERPSWNRVRTDW